MKINKISSLSTTIVIIVIIVIRIRTISYIYITPFTIPRSVYMKKDAKQ